jgi:surfeit locus 1 family protein
VSFASSVLVRAAMALSVIALLASLGAWQLDRAQQKRDLHEAFKRQLDAPPLELALQSAAEIEAQAWRAASGRGHYGPPVMLLDNRVRDGRVGYEILSAFTLEDGRRILVDRGWLPAPPTRDELPRIALPADAVSLRGRLAPAPSTGIVLGEAAAQPEAIGGDTWRVQHVDFTTLNERFPPGFLPMLVYLDAGEPAGYDREWALPAPDDGKHTAYAVQWFAMAAAVAVIFLIYLRRRAAAPTTANPSP